MKRYYPPQVEAKRQEALFRFYGFEEQWVHSVYALVARENGQKVPIYVGESARPRQRFRSHLKVAYGGRGGSTLLQGELRRRIKKESLIEMHGLAGVGDRVEALSREAGWARALERRGFRLANSWPEHRASSRVAKVPEARMLSSMSLVEAHALGVGLLLVCSHCGLTLPLAPRDLLVGIGSPKLNRFQSLVGCSECGHIMRSRLKLPAGVQAKSVITEPSNEEVVVFLAGIGRV